MGAAAVAVAAGEKEIENQIYGGCGAATAGELEEKRVSPRDTLLLLCIGKEWSVYGGEEESLADIPRR